MLERLFHLRENGTTARTELLAGLTTFVTLAYILFVNPNILKDAGMPLEATFAATCIASAFATAIMGLYANYPIAVAPAMGHNFYFAFVVAGPVAVVLDGRSRSRSREERPATPRMSPERTQPAPLGAWELA